MKCVLGFVPTPTFKVPIDVFRKVRGLFFVEGIGIYWRYIATITKSIINLQTKVVLDVVDLNYNPSEQRRKKIERFYRGSVIAGEVGTWLIQL